MSTDGSPNDNWFAFVQPIVTILAFVIGGASTVFYRSMGWASVQGALSAQFLALEARVARIEARKDRIDATLQNVATREEVDAAADRTERRVGERITELMRMYEVRASGRGPV